MNEEAITLLITIAFVVKVVVDLIKNWTQNLKLSEGFHKYTTIAVALALGILLAYETDVGLLAALGLNIKHYWVEVIITGLFLAAGGEVIYELLNYVRTKRTSGNNNQ